MNLKKLELFGFKSFMRKLDIHFSDGITVIVGPNGCGKTNVTDALRWVLGEQNARNLRGAKMEDLIFNGTRDFKPLNVAEVSLTVDNSAGILPVEYSEVTVTRRVCRDGEPEFLINRVPGRLRDIHELFMDTGLGSRAYSVIEREMVEMVLADQPEKRRELLEEAAGIMKYKIRERQAQRKLSATDDDLHRIDDVLREVERQVRSLKRQVGAARRFQEMRDRLRELEVALALRDLGAMADEVARLRISLDESRTERDGAASRVAALEADIETARAKSTEADAALADRQRGVDAIAEEASRIENENVVRRERRESLMESAKRLATEKGELEERVIAGEARAAELADAIRGEHDARARGAERLAEAQGHLRRVEGDLEGRKQELSRARELLEEASLEVARLRAEVDNLGSHGTHLDDRDAVLSEEIGQLEAALRTHRFELSEAEGRAGGLRARIDELDRELGEASRRVEELDDERESARERESAVAVEIESHRSSLEMLRGLQESHEGFGEGARTLLERNRSLGALADSVHPNRTDLLPALDSALEAAIELLVAPGTDEAIDAVRSLRDGEGRATVVDLSAFHDLREPTYQALPADGAILGSARSFLDVSGDLGPVLDDLLSRTMIVESLEDAARLARRPESRGYRYVARNGDWAAHPGIIHGGASSGSGDSRILGRADRITGLEQRIAELDAERDQVRHRVEEIARARAEAVGRRDSMRSERDETREGLGQEDKTVERVTAEIAARELRLGTIHGEQEGLSGKRSELVARRDTLEDAIRGAGERRAKLEEAWQVRENELVASTEDRDQAKQACHDLHLEAQRIAGELEKLELERTRVEEARTADAEGIARRAQELESIDRSLGELARELEEGLSAFAAKSAELEDARRGRDSVAQDRAGVIDELRAIEEERARWTRLRDDAAEQVHDAEMKHQKVGLEREELQHRVEREYDVKLDSPGAFENWGALVDADEETLATCVREADELRKQLDRMGAVNLVALDQYEREAKRLEFLQVQKNDLEAAREKLRRTIRKINRTARTLFMETLERVRENFQKTFGQLFEGGQADIRLADDEDPLHAPIEIFARPRGKRLANIGLMSSGERSLTAVAFLFAIYLVKPSPFCILDEVDAPLDDANIGRFLTMLKEVAEKTQFVMITHNKKTMEIADYLYGVTMEEPGISKLVSVRLGREEAPLAGPGPGSEGEVLESRDVDELVMEGSA